MSEISGIIRNGVERGWPLEEIKNSLINSGYPMSDVDSEINLVNGIAPQQLVQQITQSSSQTLSKPLPEPALQQKKFNSQDLTNYQTPVIEKQASGKIVILIIILLVLCIVAGAGLFFLK